MIIIPKINIDLQIVKCFGLINEKVPLPIWCCYSSNRIRAPPKVLGLFLKELHNRRREKTVASIDDSSSHKIAKSVL